MKYISEERLEKLWSIIVKSDRMDTLVYKSDLIRFLIESECEELNQWRMIDENTPRDRRILLLYHDGDVRIDWWHHESQQDNKIAAWMELPEPPK